MKFAMNGALTIGTLDGANIEIRDAVGTANFFEFGLTAEQVRAAKTSGYSPAAVYAQHPQLREILDLVKPGRFSEGDAWLFAPIVDAIVNRDEYLLLADYDAYVECQGRVDAAFSDVEGWTRASILTDGPVLVGPGDSRILPRHLERRAAGVGRWVNRQSDRQTLHPGDCRPFKKSGVASPAPRGSSRSGRAGSSTIPCARRPAFRIRRIHGPAALVAPRSFRIDASAITFGLPDQGR
jgi:carbohydrate phosphorylase